MDYDKDFRPIDLAAESITTQDNKVWTIKLLPGWKFHNGEPVTADSYINAWNAGAWGPNAHDGNNFFAKIAGYDAMNPRDGKTAPTAKKLTGLRKVDDLTFEVELSRSVRELQVHAGLYGVLSVAQGGVRRPCEQPDRSGLPGGTDRTGRLQDEGQLAA